MLVKNQYKILLCILSTVWLTAIHAQQDIQFSQYIFNGMSVNPAYAGYKEDLNFNATYRQQWTSFPGAPKNGFVSLDGLTNTTSKQTGLGVQLAWDKLGPQESVSLYGSYAYRIQLDDEDSRRLCLGLSFGLTQYALNGNLFQPVDANDPEIPSGKLTTFKPDARFGIYYFTPTYYLGLSFMDLFAISGTQKINFSTNYASSAYQKQTHMYFTAGCIWNVSDDWVLKPSLMLKEDFLGPTSIDASLMALLSQKVWVGASYRTAAAFWNKSGVVSGLDKKGAVSGMLQFFANNKMRIGYSYDFITSGLSGYQSGSHEISIGLLWPSKTDAVRIKSPRYF